MNAHVHTHIFVYVLSRVLKISMFVVLVLESNIIFSFLNHFLSRQHVMTHFSHLMYDSDRGSSLPPEAPVSSGYIRIAFRISRD